MIGNNVYILIRSGTIILHLSVALNKELVSHALLVNVTAFKSCAPKKTSPSETLTHLGINAFTKIP